MSDTTSAVLGDDEDGALGEMGDHGPSVRMQELLELALAGPSVMRTFGTPEHAALVDRVAGCTEWSDLEPADRELLDRGLEETRAGQSPVLTDPAAWSSNWQLEDYLLEQEAAGDEVKGLDLPDLDDDAWVGVGDA